MATKRYPIMSVQEREERAARRAEGVFDTELDDAVVHVKNEAKGPTFRNKSLQSSIDDRLRAIDPLYRRTR